MIQFTHKCTADLGIIVDDRVVAVAFFIDWRNSRDRILREEPFTVFDLIAGGEPILRTESLAEVCNKLLAIANASR